MNLNENNGILLRDEDGQPALLSYFDDPADPKITVSVMTDALDDDVKDRIERYEDNIGLEMEEYQPIIEDAVPTLRSFYRELGELTGIEFEFSLNNADADLVIAGFEDPSTTVGSGIFPRNATYPTLGADRIGDGQQTLLLMKNSHMQGFIDGGKEEGILKLAAHETGHILGLIHSHDEEFNSDLDTSQRHALTRMAYTSQTSPAVVNGPDTGLSPMDIFVLRNALRAGGVDVPEINTRNNYYLLADLTQEQIDQTEIVNGTSSLTTLTAISLLDGGGTNTLEGSAGSDILVSESGYCGWVDQENQHIFASHNGVPFCLVEGELSLVQSGDGNDLILTANGTEQTVHTGTGIDEVAVVHEDVGDKTVDAPAESDTTLTLHYSLFRRANASVSQDGDDIVLAFHAPSGREVGRMTLLDQTIGEGVDHVKVIDDGGQEISSHDVRRDQGLDGWEGFIINPIKANVHKHVDAEPGLGAPDYFGAQQGLAIANANAVEENLPEAEARPVPAPEEYTITPDWRPHHPPGLWTEREEHSHSHSRNQGHSSHSHTERIESQQKANKDPQNGR